MKLIIILTMALQSLHQAFSPPLHELFVDLSNCHSLLSASNHVQLIVVSSQHFPEFLRSGIMHPEILLSLDFVDELLTRRKLTGC
jgi:hypothetical protein